MEIILTKRSYYYKLFGFEGNTPTMNCAVKYKEWNDKYGSEKEYDALFTKKNVIVNRHLIKSTYSTNNIYFNNIKVGNNLVFNLELREDLMGKHKGRVSCYFSNNKQVNDKIYEEVNSPFVINKIVVESNKVVLYGDILKKYNAVCEYLNNINYDQMLFTKKRKYNVYDNECKYFLSLNNILQKKGIVLSDMELSNYLDKLFILQYKELLNDLNTNLDKSSVKAFNILNKYLDLSGDEIQEWFINFNRDVYLQKIFAGAPGTGKSYKVEKELLNSIDNKNVIRTTFYQDYEYHNFIGSILPQIDGEILNYNFVPGPFTLALERALNCKTQQVYLIIEEMTRGNCAAIFGDTFQLLDRNNNGESEYPINNLQLEKYLGIEKIKIPNNLSIIGTINTSDQNVFPMDTAFKRRFDFEYVSTDPEYDFVNFNILGDVSWLDFYQKLNEIILDITNSEDKQLGPYFLKENDNLDKLYMYLWQDVLLNGKHSKVNRIFKRNMVTLSKIINCKEKPFVDNLINIEDTNEYN